MTFEKVYEEFKIYASMRHKKQCFDTITQNFNKYVLPFFKDFLVENLSFKDIIQWKTFVLQFDFSNNYNKNIYCSFNSFLNYCVLCSYIPTNYLSVIGSFKKKFEEHHYNTYNLREYYYFRNGVVNIVYRYFFDILYFYGLRSGEAMALKFSSLNGRYLHVGSSINRRGNREISFPKTNKSNRYIKLSYFSLLKLYVLKCFYIKKYGVMSSDYFIFGGKKPLSPTSINRYKHNSCVNRNIKEITLHEFRHSCATRLFLKGVDVYYISKLLGHSSISITLDIYTHTKEKNDKSFFLKLDFFNTITQNFKKILQFIITHFV